MTTSPKRRLLVIVSSTAGMQDAFPDAMQEFLEQQTISFLWKSVKTPIEARAVVRQYASKVTEIIVYGGDGTILAVVKAAFQQRLPILPLSGGTANAFAADLNMPSDPMESLKLYLDNQYVLRTIDVARAGQSPFILDLHFGLWAKALTSTPRSAKRRFGKVAYALTAYKEFSKARPNRYQLEIDGVRVDEMAYVLMVANSGVQEVLGARIFAQPHGRGLVQVALIKKIDNSSLLHWYRKRRWGRGDQSVIASYEAKEVIIKKAPRSYVFDDQEKTVKLPLTITARPEAAMLVVPLAKSSWSLKAIRTHAQLNWHRLTDRWQRARLGMPSQQTSLIAPGIFLGGQYDRRVEPLFNRWGVKGIINMRKQRNPLQFSGIALMHLPTQDWRAPSIDALRRGVDFIATTRKQGGAVYIHCRAGEGRGPTMAAAYLIAEGMRTNDALAHLRRYRPYARPSAEQRRQLTRWEELVNRQSAPSRSRHT